MNDKGCQPLPLDWTSKQKHNVIDRQGFELEILSWFEGPREVRTITIAGLKVKVDRPGPGVMSFTFGATR